MLGIQSLEASNFLASFLLTHRSIIRIRNGLWLDSLFGVVPSACTCFMLTGVCRLTAYGQFAQESVKICNQNMQGMRAQVFIDQGCASRSAAQQARRSCKVDLADKWKELRSQQECPRLHV